MRFSAGAPAPTGRRCCSTSAAAGSDRGAHDVLSAIADEAAITADFTGGHVLRHTFGTRLVREGHDIVLVAELMGHARLETTRAYSLPTDADREAAINSLLADR